MIIDSFVTLNNRINGRDTYILERNDRIKLNRLTTRYFTRLGLIRLINLKSSFLSSFTRKSISPPFFISIVKRKNARIREENFFIDLTIPEEKFSWKREPSVSLRLFIRLTDYFL